jgi:hypothetical protein
MAETEGVSKRFDPRFSPAFQPGYDPRVHREEPPSAPLRDEPSTGWAETRPERFEYALPEPVEPELADEPEEEPEPVAWWRRFNPWLVVLWVLGVVFILAGLGLIHFVADWTQNGQQGGDYQSYLMSVMLQMAWFGAPMLITLGLATLTSTVVILAARWHRGR